VIPAAAEVMVMVGDPSARRRGYAACAVRAIAHYAALRLGVAMAISGTIETARDAIALVSESAGTITIVPEPTSCVALAASLCLGALVLRRRHSARD
jgi:hypothetical protein